MRTVSENFISDFFRFKKPRAFHQDYRVYSCSRPIVEYGNDEMTKLSQNIINVADTFGGWNQLLFKAIEKVV